MLFSSTVFVFLFLPIVLATYFLSSPKCRNGILLIASIVFYAWEEPYYVLIMLLTILNNYLGAICVAKYKHKKILLALFVLLDLSVLIYFKYFNFIVENVTAVIQTRINFIDVVMPIGISFYTFQALSYLVDVYRKEVSPQKNLFKLALYISLFPQLVAGPIVKYHDIENQLDNRISNAEDVIFGIKRFIIGLAKKMLIANTCGAVVDQIFELPPEQLSVATSWLGALFYSLQLFFDFSGYSDMAIGLGRIFGFKFLENFNYPYISKSITEFWRRWHISLSTWFKQYLYIPLGGNRKGNSRTYINLFVVFLATGIWHGAAWNFVVWGLWHGIFIILEKRFNWVKEEISLSLKFVKHSYTLLVVMIGWVIFRAQDLTYAVGYIKNMFGLLNNNPSNSLIYYIDRTEILIALVGFLISMPIFQNWLKAEYKKRWTLVVTNLYWLILFLLSVTKIALSTYNPFIYFRF